MNNNEHDIIIPATRHSIILDIIKKEKSVSVVDLSKRLYINEATIRRDLNKFQKSGLVSRTYGGAVYVEGMDSEIPLKIRVGVNTESKIHMAKLASGFINDGDSIFLDSSSSVEYLIPHLKLKKNLKIVTNGAKLAVILAGDLSSIVYCTGGKIREHSLSYAGHLALQALDNYYFNKAFFSCRGISIKNGLTDINEEEAALRKLVMQKSSISYLLADSSKFDNISFCSIAPVETIDYIITEKQPSSAWLDIEKQGIVRIVF